MGPKAWVSTEIYEKKIHTAEILFLTRGKGCTKRDLIRNEVLRNELKMYVINNRTNEYKNRWTQHVNRMANARSSKKILNYKPQGKRNLGTSRKNGRYHNLRKRYYKFCESQMWWRYKEIIVLCTYKIRSRRSSSSHPCSIFIEKPVLLVRSLYNFLLVFSLRFVIEMQECSFHLVPENLVTKNIT